MNFQRLVGLLKKSQENWPFQDIVGYEDIKRLFRMALDSESRTHVLLVGPPASAKTMFLTSLLQFLKKAYFVDRLGHARITIWNLCPYQLMKHTNSIMTNGMALH